MGIAPQWRRSTTTSSCRLRIGAIRSRRFAGVLPTIQSTTASRRRACGCLKPRLIRKRLELLAQHGIKFTILAPNQCRRVRPLREDASASDPAWTTPLANSVDTTRPYLMRFDSGVSIAIFFYDGATSRAIAFEGLLNSGDNFAARLKAGIQRHCAAAA